MSINPVRDDLVIPLGQNHNIRINFFQDNLNSIPADMSGKVVTLTIKGDNSQSNDKSVLSIEEVVEGDSCDFSISPDDTRSLGEGVSWYDVWIKEGDGESYSKAIVYGSINIIKLTNSE